MAARQLSTLTETTSERIGALSSAQRAELAAAILADNEAANDARYSPASLEAQVDSLVITGGGMAPAQPEDIEAATDNTVALTPASLATLDRRFGPFVSPLVFGAVLDGVTDDLAAFTAMAAALVPGDIVDLGGATASISASVTIADNNVTIRNGAVTAGDTTALLIDGDDCTIDNLTITRGTGGSGTTAQQSALVIAGARTKVIDCTFTDARLACIHINHGGGNYSEIRGCTFTNTSARQNACAIYAAAGATGNIGIKIRDCTITGTGCPDGIQLYDASDCEVRSCQVSDVSALADFTLTGWVLQSGTIYRAADRTDGTTNVVTVDGTQYTQNTATPTTPGASQWGSDGGFVYINNGAGDPSASTVLGRIVGGYGIMIYCTNAGAVCSNNLVSDNHVDDCDGFGIYLQLNDVSSTSLGNTTRNNVLTNCGGAGRQDTSLPFAVLGINYGLDTLCIGDRIISPASAAIPGVKIASPVATPSTGRMIGVVVVSSLNVGFHVTSGEWTLIGCEARGSASDGFLTQGTQATAVVRTTYVGCRALTNTLRGFYADKGSGSLVQVSIIGGLCKGNTQSNIRLSDTQGSIVEGVEFADISANTSFPAILMTGTIIDTVIGTNHYYSASATSRAVSVVGTATGTVMAPQGVRTTMTAPMVLSAAVRVAGGHGMPSDFIGTATPEGAVTAPIGSTFRRTDGGASTSLYVKESGTGNTGWVAK